MVSAPARDQSNPTSLAQLRILRGGEADHVAVGLPQIGAPLLATVEHGGIELIDRLAPAWRTLCAEAGSEPFVHPDWLRTYLATRAPEARVVLVTAYAPGAGGAAPQLTAVLPMLDERIRLAGVPLRRWRSMGDLRSPERLDIVCRLADRDAAVVAVWDALRLARGWDLVELAAVPPGGAAAALHDVAASAGVPVASRVALTTPRIPLTDPTTGQPALAAALGGATTKFKANLRRRRRNLEQLGPVRLRRVEHADEALIEQFLAMEAAGWKGQNGSAIAQRPDTDAFYRRIAHVAADNGWLTIYALLCADRPVAIHLGLTWPGADGTLTYGVPKLAYDETLAAYAPGHLLVAEILADLVARGVTEFDFLANDAPWKREWTDALRPCDRLFIFNRSPRPRLAHALRFRVFPVARRKKLALNHHLRTIRSALSKRTALNARPFTRTPPELRMTASPSPTIGGPLFAPIEATIAPRMLLPRLGRRRLPFPFDAGTLRYHYLGRNASHAVVAGLGLADQEMLFPAFFGPPVLQAPVDAGAKIRYYNVGPGLRVDIADIEAALTPETKAVYLVHFNGFPGPIKELLELAEERSLTVVEDAAHALLTTIDGQPAGSFGDAAIFSLYKWIPVPNGAALVVNRPGGPDLPAGTKTSRTSGVALATFSLLDHLALRHGAPAERLRAAVRGLGKRASKAGNLTYVSTGGATYHRDDLDWAMSGISHRILRAQDLPAVAARRRRNYTRLGELIGDVAPAIQGPLPEGVTPLFYPIAVENKPGVLLRLRARGVEGRNFWALHHETLPPGVFPETDELRRTTLELPIHQDLDDAAIDRMAAVVREVLGGQSTSVRASEAA